MEINVRLFAPYKGMVGEWVVVNLPGPSATVQAVIRELLRAYPVLQGQIAAGAAAEGLPMQIALLVGDTIVGPDHPMEPGDTLIIVPSIVGG